MKLSKKQIIRILIILLFFACMLYANFYAIRKIMRYGVELNFYDKLSVAYDIGAKHGMEQELKKMLASNRFPKELVLAKAFESQLKNLKDPASYVDEQVKQNTNKISFIRNLRIAAIIIMFFLFIFRISANISCRYKQKQNF